MEVLTEAQKQENAAMENEREAEMVDKWFRTTEIGFGSRSSFEIGRAHV